MSRYLLRRILRGLLTIFISVSLTFFIVRAMPSDPVSLMVSPQMTPEAQQAMIEAYGLDEPLMVQYGKFLVQLFQGNLGTSFSKHIPVTQYLLQRPALDFAAAGRRHGAGAGHRHPRWACMPPDEGARWATGSSASWSLWAYQCLSPSFRSCCCTCLPSSSRLCQPAAPIRHPRQTVLPMCWDVAKHLVLPAVALAITNLANAVMYTRNGMIDVLHEDYIRTAYSKGNSERRVILHHALKNAMIPTRHGHRTADRRHGGRRRGDGDGVLLAGRGPADL